MRWSRCITYAAATKMATDVEEEEEEEGEGGMLILMDDTDTGQP